jgi:hypothetical protein
MSEKPNWIDTHIKQISLYQQQIKELPEVCVVERIELLSKMLVFIGKLAAELSEEYKMIYADRKRMYAEAYLKATRNKATEAELAVVGIRKEEAQAYGNMKRWGNAFESTREELNAHKYKLKVSIEDGSSRRGS